MDQVPQRSGIASISCRLDERWVEAAAQATAGFASWFDEIADKAFSTDRAESTLNGAHGSEALLTDGQAGNSYKRRTANAAIGRKQRREEAVGDPAGPGNKRSS